MQGVHTVALVPPCAVEKVPPGQGVQAVELPGRFQ